MGHVYISALLNDPVSASCKYQVTQSNSKPTNPKYQIRFKVHYWHWAWAANLDPILNLPKIHRDGQKGHLNLEPMLDPVHFHATDSKRDKKILIQNGTLDSQINISNPQKLCSMA